MQLLEMYYKHKGLVRYTLFVVGLLFVIILVNESRNEIYDLLKRINKKELAISIIIGVFCNVVLAIFFNRLLGKHGVKITDRLALRIYMVGQIARYIPGKLWSIAYQISHVEGVANAAGIILANLELMFLAMYLTSMVAIILLCFLVSKPLAIIVSIVGLIIFISLYKSKFIHKNLIKLQSRFKSSIDLSNVISLPTSYTTGAALYITFCFAYVLSYIYMLNSVFDFSLEVNLIYIAVLSLAWVGGVLAFVVPMGMGVRELLFVVMSGYVIHDHSVEILISIAILGRMVQIIQELAGVLLAVLVRR